MKRHLCLEAGQRRQVLQRKTVTRLVNDATERVVFCGIPDNPVFLDICSDFFVQLRSERSIEVDVLIWWKRREYPLHEPTES